VQSGSQNTLRQQAFWKMVPASLKKQPIFKAFPAKAGTGLASGNALKQRNRAFTLIQSKPEML